LVQRKLAELARDNAITFTGGFTTESYILHQLVGPEACEATVRFSDKRKGPRPDWYYIRVTQANGHLAWSSPVWVG